MLAAASAFAGSSLAGSALGGAPVGEPARIDQQGVVVEMGIRQRDGSSALIEGKPARFEFFLHDASQGAPLVGLTPAAWLAPREAGEPSSPELCRRKVGTFLGGSIFSRATLDLTTYQVLVLNEEPKLEAMDPEFGFGLPRKVAEVPLPAPAFDWKLDGGHRHVFLSLPQQGAVARVDTTSWALELVQGAFTSPERLLLQGDDHYLWAAVAGGVAAFTSEPFALAAVIATHPGLATPPTALELSADGGLLFVAHAGSRRLVVIDTAQLEARPSLELPALPVSLAFSALAKRLYVSLEGAPAESGRVVVVDEQARLLGAIATPPDPGLIRFALGGRYGIVLHSAAQMVSILDSARGRVVQAGNLGGIPDQISFSSELAYLRLRDRTEILMLPLAVLGREGEKIPTFDTVGGDHLFLDGFRPLPALSMVQPPGVEGVLIANPGDHAVYFYKEGMAAPMGQLLLGSSSPRAVLALDRSLRELAAGGHYETIAKLPAAGEYDVVFFLDSPRIVHCFPLQVAAAAVASPAPEKGKESSR